MLINNFNSINTNLFVITCNQTLIQRQAFNNSVRLLTVITHPLDTDKVSVQFSQVDNDL